MYYIKKHFHWQTSQIDGRYFASYTANVIVLPAFPHQRRLATMLTTLEDVRAMQQIGGGFSVSGAGYYGRHPAPPAPQPQQMDCDEWRVSRKRSSPSSQSGATPLKRQRLLQYGERATLTHSAHITSLFFTAAALRRRTPPPLYIRLYITIITLFDHNAVLTFQLCNFIYLFTYLHVCRKIKIESENLTSK